MARKKISIIGGGSAYTAGIIETFIRESRDFAGSEICLMDIDEQALQIVVDLARNLVRHAGVDLRITQTTNRDEALRDADFVLTQFRIGGLKARALDEKIPLQYGVIGQETTGPGGFSMALRAIPVAVDLAKTMEKLSPNGWIINYANPTGMVTDAIMRTSSQKVIGLCDEPIGVQNVIARLLRVSSSRLAIDNMGINHMGWLVRVYLDGKDITGRVVRLARLIPEFIFKDPQYRACIRLMREYGMIPSPYLAYYYFQDEIIKKARGQKTRAEVIMKQLPEIYGHYAEQAKAQKPRLRKRRGVAGHADLAVKVIGAIANDKKERYVVNIKNQGAIPDFSPDQIVEVPAIVGKHGAVPIKMGPLPEKIRDLILAVKKAEDLNVEAALTGSYEKALAAFKAHPLIPTPELAPKILDELLAAHRAYLPQFCRFS